MSRRTSSGSRFQSLPIEGEDEESDSSVQEMTLSRDFYPTEVKSVAVTQTNVSGQSAQSAQSSSSSSAGEMKLSRDYYPVAIPTSQRSQQLSDAEDKSKYLPATSGPSSSRIKTAETAQRSTEQRIRSKPVPAEEPSDLPFIWDHYRRESQEYDVEGADALDNLYGVPQGTANQGSLSHHSSTSTQDISQNIMEDVEKLKETGFNIQYPHGMLGEGYYGQVYRGHYGTNVPGIGSLFAVKIYEFGSETDSDTMDRREKFETEKYILTDIFHKNLVTIRMIINMGEVTSYPFVDKPENKYFSPERVYLIMDFAEGGELDDWLNKNYNKMEPSLRIELIRDLFAGMQYLHSMDIIHGDVHTGNVLIFSGVDRVVPKWTDFGMGIVGSDKRYRFRIPKHFDKLQQTRLDIAGMYSVFQSIMRNRHQCRTETPDEKKRLDEVLLMLRMMKLTETNSLDMVFDKFRNLLEEEIIIDEQHYQ